VRPVREAIAEAAAVLQAAGVDAARVEAELLAAAVLGVPRSRLDSAGGFDDDGAARYAGLVRERAGRRPVQHLVGTAPFRLGEVAVGPGVFIPRPETELLVDWGLDRLHGSDAPLVVDLCSGTGAIALAVAQEHPGARVYAVEDSSEALEWLRRNTSGVPAVTVVAGDATDPATLSELDGRVDLVLCNPPYVPAGTPVPPEVGVHDPYRAVFAGPDGLDVIRRVVPRAAALLRPGGWFGVEHDDSQGGTVPALLENWGKVNWGEVEDHRDLAGRPRFATARRLADFSP
jgi:release factor glutamine methyltransferase